MLLSSIPRAVARTLQRCAPMASSMPGVLRTHVSLSQSMPRVSSRQMMRSLAISPIARSASDINNDATLPPRRVTVFCASSESTDARYLDAAYKLGRILGASKHHVIYGGGARGSMGRVADGALAAGTQVTGILPRFMDDLEWGHGHLSELILTDTLHERKALLLETEAVVALPGGTGTLEELIEAITMKRLGFFLHPIVIVNVNGYFDPLLAMLSACIEEKFMHPKHYQMWSVVDDVDQVEAAMAHAPVWQQEDRKFAAR